MKETAQVRQVYRRAYIPTCQPP